MILLGVNAGFGNADCATLPKSVVDLEGGWIRFPRPKTGIERRCPLWTETMGAMKTTIAERPTPKDAADADLVFVTKYGHRWVRTQGEKHTPIDSVLLEFGKLLKRPQCPTCGACKPIPSLRSVERANGSHWASRSGLRYTATVWDSMRYATRSARLPTPPVTSRQFGS